MVIKVGQSCQTPDGPGVVQAIEWFGNGDADYRLGVEHDIYPANRVPGFYRDDVLYYFPREVALLPGHMGKP